MKFAELGLDPKLLQAIDEAGYETPTPIQEQAIPHALQGRDVLGIAQTGTGKTASFTLPMIALLSKGRARARMPRSLILAPTRELAAQVSESFETYGKRHSLTKALLIGGVSFSEQDKIIDRGVDVLIATPGRLLDHFERGKLMLSGIEIMVVDEADRMLDMGFIEDIERIFKLTPFTRQTLFFSATMPPEITRLTQEFLSNPVRVEVARQSTAAETVTQKLCVLPGGKRDRVEREKRAALRALLDSEGEALTNAIVFCNRKVDVGVLYKSLNSHGYDVAALHGDLDQRIRTQVLDSFRAGSVKILVASDVAARGLDIPHVSHVFNFDVPMHAEDYVHRIGRTGRAGREGAAFTICSPADTKNLDKVEQMLGAPIPRIDLPGVTDRSPDSEEDEPRREKRGERRGERRRGRGGRDGAQDSAEGEADARPARREKREDAKAEPAERNGEARRGERDRGDRERNDRDRGDRGDRDRGDRDRSERGDRGRGDRRRRDGGGGPDRPVVGMGDHVPAFLLREVPLPARRKATDDVEEAEETGEFDSGDSRDAA